LTIKTGIVRTSTDETTNEIIKNEITIKNQWEGWMTYSWFIDNAYPTKKFSTGTLKKKGDLPNACDYVSSYQSSVIKITNGAGSIKGIDRGTIDELEATNWEGYSYYDAQNNKRLLTSIKKLGIYDTEEIKKLQQNDNKLKEFIKDIEHHKKEKKIRKMLAMKINES
jgi:hypothetical protein